LSRQFKTTNYFEGHLLQGRNKAILIQKDSHLLEVCRYVVLNPVRAHLVQDPGLWRWSSYGATAGREKPPACLTTSWVLRQFSSKRRKAEKEYCQYVRSGIGKDSIWERVKGDAVEKFGYIQRAVADYLGLHFTYVSRISNER